MGQRQAQKHRQFLRKHKHKYDKMLKEQGGGCAICGRPPKVRKLDMDHDHKRMILRGLLCIRCNRALTYWMSSEWLESAAQYLRKYEGDQ